MPHGAYAPRADKVATIAAEDPFTTLDRPGVGRLIQLTATRARTTRRDITLGLCGEHGGDPRTIEFCEELGMSYVSCSPYRLLVARLAVAQAALRKRS